jgi:hypothetical protein
MVPSISTAECQIRILADDGDVLLDRRIATARDRLTTVFVPVRSCAF